MIEYKIGTTPKLRFQLSDGAGVTLGTVVVKLSKADGVEFTGAGAVTEVGNGLYDYQASATDTSTAGNLSLVPIVDGTVDEPMAYEIVTHTRAEVMAAVAGLNDLSAAGVRAELATELARIDVDVSSRNAVAPDNAAMAAIAAAVAGLNDLSAAGVRAELATELARIDVDVSSRNAVAPDNAGVAALVAALALVKAKTDNLPVDPAGVSDVPSVAEIIGAAGGLTAGTVAALEAAEQILLTGIYEPVETPVAILDAPDDADLVTVYVDTEDMTGEALSQEVIKISLESEQPALSAAGKLVGSHKRLMEHQEGTPGRYVILLERGLKFSVSNRKIFGGVKEFETPAAGDSVNLKD